LARHVEILDLAIRSTLGPHGALCAISALN
jgi:hypothetical protein